VFLAACFLVIATSGAFSQNIDTLSILHTSDLHILYNMDACHPSLLSKHHVGRGSVDSLERFFSSIPQQAKADAVIVTGDLLDVFEGETKSHGLLANQIEQFRFICSQCPVPLYLTLGNHDLTTYTVHDVDASVVESQASADRARASWIRNIACFHDGTYYTKFFRVGRTNYHFIFLDNGYSLHDGGRVVDKTQLDWLQEQVSRAGSDPIVLFFHIYFAVGDINGDGILFKENGPLNWPSEKQCSEGLLKVLNEHRNIKAMVVGHGHSNVFEGIRFPGGHKIYQVETGSVSEGSLNWRLFQFTETNILVSHPGTRKSEIVIELNQKGE
jgi:3',5'-cyclic AMP phosphodiesterase CpdA